MKKIKKGWSTNINLNLYKKDSLSNNDKKEIIEFILSNFSKNNCSDVIEYSLYLILEDQKYYFSSLKRKGFFRMSTNKFKTKTIDYIIQQVLNKLGSVLEEKNRQYLESMLLLHNFAPECTNILKFIDKGIRKDKKSFIKTLYALLDSSFMEMENYFSNPKNIIDDTDLSKVFFDVTKNFNVNDVAEAVSTLINIYKEKFDIDDDNFHRVNENYIDDLKKLIFKAMQLNIIKKIEYQIEIYKYTLKKEGKKIYFLNDEDGYFEKAKILGAFYLYTQHYNAVVGSLYHNKNVLSLYDFSERLINSHNLWEKKYEPSKRLVLRFPWDEDIGNFFYSNTLFREEIAFLNEQAIEFHIDDSNLDKMKFKDGLSLFDIIKLRRFIIFFGNSLNIELNKEENKSLIYNWILPVIKYDEFINLLNYIYKDENKVHKIVDTLILDKNENYDIQTTPIIKGNDYITFGFNILGTSNIFRNLFFKKNERLDYNIEILEDKLCESFGRKNIKNNKSIKFKFQELEGDIDFIAKSQNIVLVAECKNSLFASNIYEMRTNYEHLQKGAEQLSKIEKLFYNNDFINYISKKIDFDIDKNDKFIFFMVSGNRVLYGLNEFKYNIFPIYEILNYIQTHEIIFKNSVYSFYDEKKSFLDNLVNFINKNPNQNTLRNSLEYKQKKVCIGNKSFSIGTYDINFEKHETLIKQVYQLKSEDL